MKGCRYTGPQHGSLQHEYMHACTHVRTQEHTQGFVNKVSGPFKHCQASKASQTHLSRGSLGHMGGKSCQ